MNFADWIVILILVILAIAGFRNAKKRPDCTGDCMNCKSSCSPHDEKTPAFVDRYYRRQAAKGKKAGRLDSYTDARLSNKRTVSRAQAMQALAKDSTESESAPEGASKPAGDLDRNLQ